MPTSPIIDEKSEDIVKEEVAVPEVKSNVSETVKEHTVEEVPPTIEHEITEDEFFDDFFSDDDDDE